MVTSYASVTVCCRRLFCPNPRREHMRACAASDASVQQHRAVPTLCVLAIGACAPNMMLCGIARRRLECMVEQVGGQFVWMSAREVAVLGDSLGALTANLEKVDWDE